MPDTGTPPAITLRANSWFYDGWMHGALGLPQRTWDNPDSPVRDEDIDAWVDGYDMAKETKFDLTAVLAAEMSRGRITVTDRLA